MESLKQRRGATPEWPWLLRQMLTDTYLRVRESDSVYGSEVFKHREDDFPFIASPGSEKRLVKELFHHCRLMTGRRLEIGNDPYWLLGYEWPNQGGDKEKMARGDLVGLNSAGGLVVFECKRAKNKNDGPLTAAVEGLDYLSHLTTCPNFAKVEAGFSRWVVQPHTVRPPGFEAVTPTRTAPHEVIVLAPREYFAQHRSRAPGWELFAALPFVSPSPLVLRFAESDFTSATARWVTG